jgi:hypothetical protein
MKPEFPPDTIKVYQLIKRNADMLYFSGAGTAPATGSIGIGFYQTRQEAEHQRTIEVLKSKTNEEFYVFELEIPNPIVK